MKGSKKRNSNSEFVQLQPSDLPPPDLTAAVNQVEEDVAVVAEAEAELSKNLEGETEVTEEAFEEEEEEIEAAEVEAEAEAEVERPQLAEGYFEMEAVRNKRIRKGKEQYLIKWRGYSEAESTWEPVENLLQCLDIIDAFEEGLKSGKGRVPRGRKRKINVTNEQGQQNQSHLTPEATSFNLSSRGVRIVENPIVPFKENENGEAFMKVNEKEFSAVSEEEKEQQKELGLKICELKGSTSMSVEDTDMVDLSYKENQLTEGDGLGTRSRMIDAVEQPVPLGRCVGAKRRKSGSVKRFKKDPDLRPDDHDQIAVGSHDSMAVQHPDSKILPTITQIVKPISYKVSTTDNVEEVFVVFEAIRSDGTKTSVDNKFLKANNPLLLIDFYESHLHYNPTQ